MGVFGPSAEAQGHNVNPPTHTGTPGQRYVIRNAYVMTMEPGRRWGECSDCGRSSPIHRSTLTSAA